MGAAAVLAQPLPAQATPARIRIGRLTSLAATHAVLLAGAAFMLLPFVWMLTTSIKPPAEIFSADFTLWPRKFTPWRTMIAALTSAPLLRFALNGVIICSGILVVQLLVAIPCAYALAKLKLPRPQPAVRAGAPRPVHPGAGAGAAALHRAREARAPEHLFRDDGAVLPVGVRHLPVPAVLQGLPGRHHPRRPPRRDERVRDRLAHRRAERLAGHRRLLGLLDGRSLERPLLAADRHLGYASSRRRRSV